MRNGFRSGAGARQGPKRTKTAHEFDEIIAAKKESASLRHMIFIVALVDWVPTSCARQKNLWWKVDVPTHCAANKTVFIPKSCIVDHTALTMRSPHAPHLLTLCNCDCKIITSRSALVCNGHSIRHPPGSALCLYQTKTE